MAAVVASAGVLGAGWAVGTANGATVAGTTRTTTANTGANTSTGTTSGTSGTTNTTTTTSGSGSYKDGTYTGTTVSHPYGSVTVTVTISGGKITNVTANAVAGDRRSQSIASQAVPLMKSEVLAADSANVSTISGATYTTTAYITSLQSALAKA